MIIKIKKDNISALSKSASYSDEAGEKQIFSFLPEQISSEYEAQAVLERLSKILEEKQITEAAVISFIDTILDRFKTAGYLSHVAFFIHRCVVKFQKFDKFDDATQYLTRMASILKVVSVTDEPELYRLFILATLKLSRQMRYLKRWDANIEQFLDISISACEKLGDKRNLSLIYFQVACYCHLNNRSDIAIEMFESGFNIIEELGDEDIKFQASEYMGRYYLIQGRFRQAAKQFEKILSSGYNHHDPIQAINAVYLATCAVNMGQFVRALGITHSYWQFSKLNNNKFISIIQAFLGTMLLTMGRKEEAYQHLSEAQKDAQKKNDIWSIFWSQRAIAYYHFLNGRIEDSYQLMRSCMQLAADNNVKNPIYFAPWLPELLYEYHQNEFTIPGLDFNDEIDRLIQGPNIHLRGTAYRLLAKQAETKKEDSQTIEVLLKNSISDLTEAGDVVQLGKTKSDLALFKLRLGKETEARNLSLQAYEILSIVGLEDFPEELKTLIQVPKIQTTTTRPTTYGILNRFLEIADEMALPDDTDEFMYDLISSITRIFDAERGGFFILNEIGIKKQPVSKALYNLTLDEIKNIDFADCLGLVMQVFQNNKPVCRQAFLTEKGKRFRKFQSIFCIPVKTEGRISGVLYLDRIYNQESFEVLMGYENKKIVEKLSRLFGKIFNFRLKTLKKSQIFLKQNMYFENTSAPQIIGKSQVMINLLLLVDRLAQATAPVLITGETGVGKELMAVRLHEMSPRKNGPFIPVNISAMPETLIESELFGHEKGAYTGADRQKKGLMEIADRGTLFIDEVGDIPLTVQTKLLRAMEEKAFYRVGGMKRIKSDFRIVTATNRNLEKEVEKGRYRRDLFYRLSVVPVFVPPLRKRKDDIILIATYFLNKYVAEYKRTPLSIDEEAALMLKSHNWPGNIRELKNVIERAVIVSGNKTLDLTISGMRNSRKDDLDRLAEIFKDTPSMEELQRRYLEHILKKTNGKMTGPGGAAEILKMKNTTLYDRLKKLGIKK